jgi:hypothetical protein
MFENRGGLRVGKPGRLWARSLLWVAAGIYLALAVAFALQAGHEFSRHPDRPWPIVLSLVGVLCGCAGSAFCAVLSMKLRPRAFEKR